MMALRDTWGAMRPVVLGGAFTCMCVMPCEAQVGPISGDGLGWQAVEVFRLGGLAAPPEEEFTNQLLSLSLGPNDQLYVLDLFGGRIQVFSARDGRYVRTVARPGRGPGEILDATALGWDGEGRLWVKEPFARRFSVFDSTGAFIRTVPRPDAAVPRRTGRVAFDGAGRLVEMASRDSGPFVRVVDPTTGKLIEEYEALPPLPIPASVPRVLVGLPEAVVEAIRRFQPRLVWDWTPEGGVWFARPDEYRLVEVDRRGDTLTIVEGPAKRRDFTGREKVVVAQARHHLRAGDSFLSPPQLQSIIRLPGGHLLVQRPGEMNDPGQMFDIFSPGGEYLGEVAMPLPVWPQSGVAAQGDRLFVVGRGDYDVPIVLAVSLHR